MTTSTASVWESKRTGETRSVEDALRKRFRQVDSYRYNSASIRVRVIDPGFTGMSRDERERGVEEEIAKLPEDIQRDIVTVFCFTPEELRQTPKTFREFTLNTEFEDPSPSTL
jgi:hypothetical protein